jgi:L-amino acid N-acyltransferase YncA
MSAGIALAIPPSDLQNLFMAAAVTDPVTHPVTVRAATPSDAEPIAAIYAPYVVETVISFEETPPTAAEFEARMLATPRLPWLVAVRADAVVGYCYASPHRTRAAYRWSADVSVYVAPSERGRGVGRLLYGELLPLVRSLGYVSLFAGIALPNAASVAFHEAFGFTPVGIYRNVGFKQNAWQDVGWWQLTTTNPPDQPPEPRAWVPPDIG